MLKQRILTAIILIPLTLLLLFFLPPVGFYCLTGLFSLACAWEWTNLMGIKQHKWRIFYLCLVTIVFFAALELSDFFIFFTALAGWLLAFVLILIYPQGKEYWGRFYFWRGLMGIFVLVPCLRAINYIREQNDGISGLLFLFIIIWGADSAAYFAGKKWGNHKLIPRVSPGKSIEGLVAALLFALFFTLVVLFIYHVPLPVWPWGLGFSMIIVIFSVIGDLFESMLKRQAGLKDSSQILPGHGGLLDRIDSLTAAAPIFALGCLLLNTY